MGTLERAPPSRCISVAWHRSAAIDFLGATLWLESIIDQLCGQSSRLSPVRGGPPFQLSGVDALPCSTNCVIVVVASRPKRAGLFHALLLERAVACPLCCCAACIFPRRKPSL